MSLRELVQVAELMQVDPRWLATGRSSAAAYAAIHQLRAYKGIYEIAEAKAEALIEHLKVTVEPDVGPGTCRYCGCTDEMGCGGCEWVDEAATICSACLIAKE